MRYGNRRAKLLDDERFVSKNELYRCGGGHRPKSSEIVAGPVQPPDLQYGSSVSCLRPAMRIFEVQALWAGSFLDIGRGLVVNLFVV